VEKKLSINTKEAHDKDPAARNVGNWLHQSLTCSYEVRNGDSPPPQETYRSADSTAERTTKESRSDAQSKGEEKKEIGS
jgi:hypothetical protein